MALCAGVHKLSKQQLEKIQKGINALAEELVAIKIKKLRISKRQVKMSKTGQNILSCYRFTLHPFNKKRESNGKERNQSSQIQY